MAHETRSANKTLRVNRTHKSTVFTMLYEDKES